MQNPFRALVAVLTGTTTPKPLTVDASGNLVVTPAASAVPAGLGYQAVPASQTAQALGTGAVGDLLSSITYIPATTAAGIVQIKDGADTAITLFVGGGTTALTDLRPVTIPLIAKSKTGAWQVTTGANVSVLAVGKFTA